MSGLTSIVQEADGWLLRAVEIRSNGTRLARTWCVNEPDIEGAIGRLRRAWIVNTGADVEALGKVPRHVFEELEIPRGEIILLSDDEAQWLA